MATVEPIRTLDQRRATHAWQCVEKIDKSSDSIKKEFGIQVKKLPTRIMTAGLGQALAFLEAKKVGKNGDKPGYVALIDTLSDWLQIMRPGKAEECLLQRVIQGDANFQRYATSECLAYLLWLVRFADAKGLTKNVTTGGH